jgi:hypothetical protein
MDQLGPKFWESPPADADLGARMLSLMSKAIYENQQALMKAAKQKADAQALLTDWPRYRTASQLFKKHAPRYDNATVSLGPARSRLAVTAQNVLTMAEAFAKGNVNADEMGTISEEAKRMFADFVEL